MQFQTLLIILLVFLTPKAQAQDLMPLSLFLNKVREQNLDLKIESAKSEASSAKSIGLAIPPPMLGVSQMREDSGNKAIGFEISQTLPFPTKLTGDYSARALASKSQNESQLARKNEILAEAKFHYISLWSAQQRLVFLLEKKSLLESHIKLSRSGARSDSFASLHVLKSESDLDLLENEILTEEQQIQEKQSEAAVLMSQDPTNFQITTEEPPLSPPPKNNSIEHSHQIERVKWSLESLRSKESVAKSFWFPDLSFRYKQIGASSLASRYNEVMVGITLPFVFFWGPHSESNTASAERAQAEFELEKQRLSIRAKKTIALSKIESLKKQMETLNQKLIPRAEKRMKLIHNLAPRDMETLQNHLETVEALPDLKLKVLELRLEYEQTVSFLERSSP